MRHTKGTYEAPAFTVLGSVQNLTRLLISKDGPEPDVITLINPAIVGSLEFP